MNLGNRVHVLALETIEADRLVDSKLRSLGIWGYEMNILQWLDFPLPV